MLKRKVAIRLVSLLLAVLMLPWGMAFADGEVQGVVTEEQESAIEEQKSEDVIAEEQESVIEKQDYAIEEQDLDDAVEENIESVSGDGEGSIDEQGLELLQLEDNFIEDSSVSLYMESDGEILRRGICGQDIEWELRFNEDLHRFILTLSGTGATYDYLTSFNFSKSNNKYGDYLSDATAVVVRHS